MIDLGAIVNIGKEVADRFLPNQKAKREFEQELQRKLNENQHTLDISQVEANKEQAKHSSIFVAGARPAAIWMCIICLAYTWFLRDFLVTISALLFDAYPILPVIDSEESKVMLTGLLGLGGYRSYEKKIGVARESM